MAQIIKGEYPKLEHVIDGVNYGFNVQDFPEDSRQWLCDMLGRQFDEIYKRGLKEW